MSFDYKRIELAKNVGFNTIIDKKFKSNILTIRFIVPLEKKSATLNALAINTLSSSSGKYDTFRKLSRKLAELYGSSMFSGIYKMGDIQVLSLTTRFIDDRFALNGENITNDIIQVFLDCLLNPNLDDTKTKFNEEVFNISKKEILDNIESEINNKRTYAMIQAGKIIYKDEPASISSYGEKEQTSKSTSKEAFESYKNLLSTACIEIFYVGGIEKPIIESSLKDVFSKLERNPIDMPITKPSVVKSQVEQVVQELDISQTKMVMALKTTFKDKYINIILNILLGSSPFSKLFANVREKLSLCYDCQSIYEHKKSTFLIDSGIEYSNFDKTKSAILQQIDDIKNGNFTDDDLENTKKYVCNSLKFIGDTQSSYISWFFSDVIFNTKRTIENEYKKYHEVTKQDVINAAKCLELDTIYILKPKNN